MKIYFACSITGGREDEAVYREIVNYLLAGGHQVPTAMLADPDALATEAAHSAREVYLRDVAWIEGCDALIAEVSTPSHGVGYEIACALARGKPVLCLHRRGVRVSKMLTGNPDENLRVRAYDDEADLLACLEAFLESLASS